MNKVLNTVEVVKNSFKDEGDGVVIFPQGLTISDDKPQRNGTRYDIDSLDISKYGGQLTADHEDKLRNIIGRVEGLSKQDGRLTINKIIYAVEQNPYARLAYDLLINGFSKSFSTETIGPMPTADGTNYNHELVGLSQVVTPNNYAANVNQLTQVVHNSLSAAEEDGLNVEGIEEKFMNRINEESMSSKEVEESATTDDVIENKVDGVDEVDNAAKKKSDDEDEKKSADDESDATESADETESTDDEQAESEAQSDDESEDADEESDDEAEDDETDETQESDKSETEDDDEASEDDDDKKKKKNALESADVIENSVDVSEETEAMVDALTELVRAIVDDEVNPQDDDEDKVSGVEEIVADDVINSAEEEKKESKEMDKSEVKNAVLEALKELQGDEAKEPVFQKNDAKKTTNSLDGMDWKQVYGKQVNAAYEAFRNGNIAAREELAKINEYNFNGLKKSGKVSNAMTIESMGNFVLPPEMYDEIQGRRTDYTALINATEWRETDSLEFAWLKRKGDIDMKNVAMCNDGNDGNLKPISEYEAEPVTSKLEEMAAVTVVCNAATRFLAADLLGDVAAGYRNDYDRKRAQLIIARLEQAVDETKQEVVLDEDSDTSKMVAWLRATSEVSDATVNGTFIFNNKTFAKLKEYALSAGTNGPLASIFTDGEVPQIFGTPYIVVPNDLMPTIESDDDVEIAVDGKNVKIAHSVFYADLSEFTGRTSGGLQYNVSTEASYEVNGQTRSAYQRNEMVLRGSFFRGGAIKDTSRVAGVTTKGAATTEG